MELLVVRPVGAGGGAEAEEGAGPLTDSLLVGQVAAGVLHTLLNDTAWRKEWKWAGSSKPDLGILIHPQLGWKLQTPRWLS